MDAVCKHGARAGNRNTLSNADRREVHKWHHKSCETSLLNSGAPSRPRAGR